MASVIIDDINLTNIANAIREKNGSSETYKPSEMPAAIGSIETGGGGGITEWTITSCYSAVASYSHPTSNNILNEYMDGKSFTINLTNSIPGFLFANCSELVDLSKVVINFDSSLTIYNGPSSIFNNCYKLEQLPRLNIIRCEKKDAALFFNLFQNCNRLRYIDNDLWQAIWTITDKTEKTYNFARMFPSCYSLRQLPDMTVLDNIATSQTSASNQLYVSFITACYTLDTVEHVPVLNTTRNITSNMFQNTFSECFRLKDIIFATNNGTPIARTWSNQTINLSSYIGYSSSSTSNILNYNSGITADKRVTDDATYAALKNDPDWFTTNMAYSRYNHDSAVRTINSLPDCSTGSGNTIKFQGASGSLTDGGAISNLTEEEIAVAAAKGWTVSLI